MFKIRDEYGQDVLGSRSDSYDSVCRIAHFMRILGNVDFFVVDVRGGRAVSEVVSDDSIKDMGAAIIAESLWSVHKELV
jgi:hypothetical protein